MKAIRHFARSSSFQVGVIFNLLLTAGVLFVAYFLYLATEEVFLKESVVALNAELDGLSYAFAQQGEAGLKATIESKQQLVQRPFYYAHIQEQQITLYSDITGELQQHSFGEQFAQRIGIEPEDVMWHQRRLSDGSILVVARDVHDLEKAQWVARTFGSLTITTMLLISGLSLLVGFYVVKTINKIADTTDSIIQSGDFKQRIPIDSSWDDLSKLSQALNGALDELAHKVDGIKSVSDNIAHDLRTPLTRLRANIERLEDGVHKDVLLNEVDTIMAMFKGLLRIADIEASKHKASFKPYRVDTIIDDVIELYGPLAEQKQQHIHCELAEMTLNCDRDLVFQALANLMDNAIKFTPKNGEIIVTLKGDDKSVYISLCDSGPGVSAHDAAKLTQRFFRADASRHESGNGLGLAMVDAVIKRHKGSLSFTASPLAKSATKGLCCEIRLPVR